MDLVELQLAHSPSKLWTTQPVEISCHLESRTLVCNWNTDTPKEETHMNGLRKVSCVTLALAIGCSFVATDAPAQTPEVAVRSEGAIQNDCLNNLDGLILKNHPLQFVISAKSEILQTGATLGFVIYSPDNSTVNDTVISSQMIPEWSTTTYWDFTGGVLNGYFGSGLPDSILTSGAAGASPGAGFQTTVFVDILSIDVALPEEGIICLDSAFVSPAGQWLMDPAGSPTWHGGGGDITVGGVSQTAFCLTVSQSPPGENPCSIFWTGLLPASAQAQLGHTIIVSDSLAQSFPELADFSVTHDGAGVATVDSAGYATYTPSPLDTNKTVEFTLSFSVPDTRSPCPSLNSAPCASSTFISVLPISPCCDAPGDADHSGSTNVADVTFMIARIFSGGPAPTCVNESDANGDGVFNITDVTFLIARIFFGGPTPVCGTIVN